ncbi:MAG: cell division protein FtsA [Bacilli bacterium]|nr:cell division protein FtsA [Bacilli bacterium]
MRKIYTSVDIGSYSIKIIVGEYINEKLYVLASSCVQSKGLKKGLIVEPDLVIESLVDAVNDVNDKLGMAISKIVVGIPDYNAVFKRVSGSVDVRGANNIITSDDVNRVIKDSVYNRLDSGYELVTVVPTTYIIDDNEETSKPVGKSGQKIEIKGIMISTPKKNIYSVLSVIESVGLEVADITISGLSDYYEVKNNKLDERVGAVINLGHEKTTVSIFEDGNIIGNETLQIGGVNVEKDLSYVFGINQFDGRSLKEKFASSHKRFCQLNEIYEVKNTVGEIVKLNQLEVSEVAMSRMVEILNLVKKQIRNLTTQDIDYVVLTGGLTEIKSFKNLAYEMFGKDVIIYNVTTLGVRDNKYTTALGMIKYFEQKMESRGREYSMFSLEDEVALVTPKKTGKNSVVNKIFGSFVVGKEDK